MTYPRLRPIVCRTLGVLLLAAAGLKVYGLTVEPVSASGFFSAPSFQAAVVQLEIFLGVWLLWGIRPIAAWVVAVVTFGCFAATSVYQGLAGQASCGCFGQLSVSPWYALTIDLAALAALFAGRPDFRSLKEQSAADWVHLGRRGAYGLAGVAGVLGLLAGFAYLRFGSVEAALGTV